MTVVSCAYGSLQIGAYGTFNLCGLTIVFLRRNVARGILCPFFLLEDAYTICIVYINHFVVSEN